MNFRQVGTVSTGNGGMKKLRMHSSVSMLSATQARQTSRLRIKWLGQSFAMKVIKIYKSLILPFLPRTDMKKSYKSLLELDSYSCHKVGFRLDGKETGGRCRNCFNLALARESSIQFSFQVERKV